MIVLGGTYREEVALPSWSALAGSGLRAAAALSTSRARPRLVTAVDDATGEEAELVRAALGVTSEQTVRRTEAVGFSYFTPLSAPRVNGPKSSLERPLRADDDTVLMFGLVESGEVQVRARTVVLDPQRPRDLGPFERPAGTDGARLVVVANSAEVRQLGDAADGRTAAESLLRDAEGVVTKRAAAGCTVSWTDGTGGARHEDIGAHPTSRVWPIGSGDVFSAGLAHALDGGADLVEAARVGSAAAAHWCSTQVPAVPLPLLEGDRSALPPPLPPGRPLVYLAGPFFSAGERWLVEELRTTLQSLGVDVFSPLHDVGTGGPEVAQADLQGLRDCDSVLALLDGADPGTVFEVGWAVRDKTPVVGYASVLDTEVSKMMSGTAVELHRDLATACYRAAWAGMGLRVVPGWSG